MHDLRFGMHNGQGIHGACPMDMLHAMLFGIFWCIRDGFFEQVGESSKLSDEINACAARYGESLSHQSDRDLPQTRFANGMRRSKLNAKEFPGILLCLGMTLRCSAVLHRLRKKRALSENWVQLRIGRC